jgi:hypothetical protein
MCEELTLDLRGGVGEKPQSPNDPVNHVGRMGFVLTAEEVREFSDGELTLWLQDQLEFDTTRGANLRLLRRELKRREALRTPSAPRRARGDRSHLRVVRS